MLALTAPWRTKDPEKNRDEELAHARNIAKEEEELEKAEYAKRHRFYAKPTRLLEWGQKQQPRESQSHDLLIDLIQVAACFQIGHFVSHNIGQPIALLGLCAFGLTTVNLWSDLLAYRSRFESASLYHSVLDGLQALFYAAAAHNLTADVDLFEMRHRKPFVFYVLATRAVMLLRLAELGAFGEDEEKGNSKATARDMLKRTFSEMCVASVGLLVTSAAGLCYLLLGSAFVQLAWTIVPSLMNAAPPREMRVPVHLEYMFRRMGELVMLALGETVLGLVLALSQSDANLLAEHSAEAHEPVDPGPGGEYLDEHGVGAGAPEAVTAPHDGGGGHRAHHRLLGGGGAAHGDTCYEVCSLTDHITKIIEPVVWDPTTPCEPCAVAPRRDLAFLGAFILISTMVYIHSHSNPLRRHHHATRRNLARGLIWSYSHWFLVIGIIGLAAAIKELFILSALTVPPSTVALVGDTLGTCLLVINVQQLLHPGYVAYACAPTGRIRRLALYSLRLALACMLFLVGHLVSFSAPGYQLLLGAGFLTLLSAVSLAAEKSDGEAYHAMWVYADRLLTGQITEAEAWASWRTVGATADASDAAAAKGKRKGSLAAEQPKGTAVFARTHGGQQEPAEPAGAGCLPCVPAGKRKREADQFGSERWGSLKQDQEWQRLG